MLFPRLVISDVVITDSGILIKEMKIIDGQTGETIKLAKFNEHVVNFLKFCELPTRDYLLIQDMQKKNPAFKKLIETFKLYK